MTSMVYDINLRLSFDTVTLYFSLDPQNKSISYSPASGIRMDIPLLNGPSPMVAAATLTL